jgi:Rha family phage regulatory protein
LTTPRSRRILDASAGIWHSYLLEVDQPFSGEYKMPTDNPSQLAFDLVVVRDGRILADSREVAVKFSKRHHHVLRDIQDLIAQAPEAASSFGLGSYADAQGQARPFYELDRDGFALLAMGFTGAAALQWKLKYIKAFNAMEAELTRRVRPLTPVDMLVEQALRLQAHERAIAAAAEQAAQAIEIAIVARDEIAEVREIAQIAEAKAQASNIHAMDWTILAYAIHSGVPVDLNTSAILGKHATRLSRERGMPIGKTRDARYCQINTYMEPILKEVFDVYLSRGTSRRVLGD